MLSSMVKNRRIPHAILIEGEEGLGKSTLSRYIALKNLNPLFLS